MTESTLFSGWPIEMPHQLELQTRLAMSSGRQFPTVLGQEVIEPLHSACRTQTRNALLIERNPHCLMDTGVVRQPGRLVGEKIMPRNTY